jgi:NADH-quinone oxidoreductase subunit F
VDLVFTDVEATADEMAALDAVVHADDGVAGWEREEGGLHRAASRRYLLLAALHALQDRVGYISEGGLGELCRRLDIPPSEAYGVASFYALFNMKPVPARTVHVCTDLACGMAGGDGVYAAGRALVDGDASLASQVRVIESPCLGVCEHAPAVMVGEAGLHAHEAIIAPATPVSIRPAVLTGPHGLDAEPTAASSVPQAGDASLVLLARIGQGDPTSFDDYRRGGGYDALRRAVAIGPAKVIEEVTASKLLGRGGAAFPAGRKWAAVAGQPARPHYLVCNADESEPGTFKDRVLLEGDPFAVIEAMTIAGFATGCELGYIYLRGEYPRALANLRTALDVARARGVLGPDVLGAGFAFDIEIVKGAGAYICGEETAIFNSIEGYRGEPRSKPPFPVEVGLFGKPTLVNNVETLANVLPILRNGGDAYAAIGTEGSTGTKLFCVSGAVSKPGVYEVPFGATLRELLALAGDVPHGDSLRAVLLGGAAGGFVGPEQLDLPLTFEGARAGGATLGSGVVLVVAQRTPIAPLLVKIAAFFRAESCGQCVPCRVGTVRQEEALVRLTVGPRRDGDLALLREVGQAMRDASICGLGQTAWNAIESAIDKLGALS